MAGRGPQYRIYNETITYSSILEAQTSQVVNLITNPQFDTSRVPAWGRHYGHSPRALTGQSTKRHGSVTAPHRGRQQSPFVWSSHAPGSIHAEADPIPSDPRCPYSVSIWNQQPSSASQQKLICTLKRSSQTRMQLKRPPLRFSSLVRIGAWLLMVSDLQVFMSPAPASMSRCGIRRHVVALFSPTPSTSIKNIGQ